MELIDPGTGEPFVRKLRRRWDDPQHARGITFSCFHRYQFLKGNRTRQWFIDSLAKAREKCAFAIWAYVLMPEHVHLLVHPGESDHSLANFLKFVKEPVARRAVKFLKHDSPAWLGRITVREGERIRHRFWQPGGGYDRNVTEPNTLRTMIEYIHNNPVRRGLVTRMEEWEWSSARWFAGLRPVALEMDRSVLDVLA